MSDIDHSRMIPLHIADQAVAACEKEIAALKAENARLRKLFADTERLMLLDGEYEAAKVGTYARLKAEVETLKEAWVDKKMQEDRDALLLEVERLRKAGDAMAFIMAYENDEEFDGFVKSWNAAKEGKQP